MAPPIVYTIIVTYNGTPWIERCLNSLLNSSCTTHIIVIDNSSSDDTVKIIKENYPVVQLIESQKNLGFGAGNNMGLSIALANHCDHVFLLNQDAWVEKDTLEMLTKVQAKNPKFGILSPVHLNGKGNKLDHDFYFFLTKANISGLLYNSLLDKTHDNSVITTPFVNAAAWLISADCLRKTGGFDPIFFHYGEDDNYAQRVIYMGFYSGIFCGARIYHDKTPSLPGLPINLKKRLTWEWKEFLIHACNPLRQKHRQFVVKRLFRHLLQSLANTIKLNRFGATLNLSMAGKIVSQISNIAKSRAEATQADSIPHLTKIHPKKFVGGMPENNGDQIIQHSA